MMESVPSARMLEDCVSPVKQKKHLYSPVLLGTLIKMLCTDKNDKNVKM